MAIDKQEVGLYALEAIDGIVEAMDGVRPEDVRIQNMMMIIEVEIDIDSDDEILTDVMFHCSSNKPVVQVGMLRLAALSAEEKNE